MTVHLQRIRSLHENEFVGLLYILLFPVLRVSTKIFKSHSKSYTRAILHYSR